ncbi:MAG: sodium:calcium antiporter [Firmicutes bacterium HGW-Firmicutes-7]|nr:MAG: sodium:calcium antiporter [Firmicutes bacterium HGW-Firmicutes-7]
METILINFLENMPTIMLVIIAALSLFTLGKGADFLVEEAVSLSVHWGVPKMIIGATIVSLGTTLPEATVSVLAAFQGNPDLALGNAIGSIIADTGLIIGIAAIIGVLPVDPTTIKRQGSIQIGVAFLLVFLALPFFSKGNEGVIYQWMGFVLLALLVLYIYISIKWAKNSSEISPDIHEEKSPIFIQIVKLFSGIAVIIISSKILIPSVEITALRIGIPQGVIAATIVAFGTSLPELMTAISSVRKGHGELAIGNIIGADILNVLFVVGAAASVTSKGLTVPLDFFYLQIPTMIIILLVFRFFAKSKNNLIDKKEGMVLLLLYLVYLVLNFTWLI